MSKERCTLGRRKFFLRMLREAGEVKRNIGFLKQTNEFLEFVERGRIFCCERMLNVLKRKNHFQLFEGSRVHPACINNGKRGKGDVHVLHALELDGIKRGLQRMHAQNNKNFLAEGTLNFS